MHLRAARSFVAEVEGWHAADLTNSPKADDEDRKTARPTMRHSSRREHRRDVLLALAGARGRPRHSRRLLHGSWPAGHAGAGRARGQDRRRLAVAALA